MCVWSPCTLGKTALQREPAHRLHIRTADHLAAGHGVGGDSIVLLEVGSFNVASWKLQWVFTAAGGSFTPQRVEAVPGAGTVVDAGNHVTLLAARCELSATSTRQDMTLNPKPM